MVVSGLYLSYSLIIVKQKISGFQQAKSTLVGTFRLLVFLKDGKFSRKISSVHMNFKAIALFPLILLLYH